MNKKQDLSEMINAMFGECDSEVARLLIEIFEVVKDSKPQEIKCTCGQTREAGEIPSAFTGVPASKYKLCAVHGVPRWKGEPESQKIQGYTSEQWQEIIDGGYLCEFSENGIDFDGSRVAELAKYRNTNTGLWFYPPLYLGFKFCRPAQLQGVMRPIFVEPGDIDAMCTFFNEDGYPLYGGMLPWSCLDERDSHAVIKATKYIEA